MHNKAFRSKVYTERPAYADYDSQDKFDAIQGIIITRLKQHPSQTSFYIAHNPPRRVDYT